MLSKEAFLRQIKRGIQSVFVYHWHNNWK